MVRGGEAALEALDEGRDDLADALLVLARRLEHVVDLAPQLTRMEGGVRRCPESFEYHLEALKAGPKDVK